MLTSKFARHKKLETTMIYIYTDKEQLYRSIDMIQEDGIFEKVRKIQRDL